MKKISKVTELSLVLYVLRKIKACVDSNSTHCKLNGEVFNLHPTFGICWHVWAYTPSSEHTGIDIVYLKPIFEEMGLHANYPVERQIFKSDTEAYEGYLYNTNLYDPESDAGKLRIQLLEDLIKYFENKLDIIS